MTKKEDPPTSPKEPRKAMLLELEKQDYLLLESLAARYAKASGSVKANKTLAIRQLIRSADKLIKLPPIVGEE